MIRNELVPKVQFIQSSNKYCIWLKIQIDKQQSLILGFIYIPPIDSVVHQNLDRYIFDVINEEVDKMNNMGPTLILGDWNARVGNLKDDMNLDELNTDWECELVSRTNIDKQINEYGLELIQLCYKQNMKLLNGRWGEASNKWTHFHKAGLEAQVLWIGQLPMKK